ncbi:MAG: phosphatase PAP2 family protein [Chloroflexota bacterium]|nr:phosphatase PAP2 family protein [Chloroflexota bacterium]
MKILWPFEFGLIRFLQNLGSWLTLPMRGFSFLGNVEFYMFAMTALYWWWDAQLGLRMVLLLLLGGWVNDTLKAVFHMPRPYWVSEEIRLLSSESSFGLPSGHAQNGVGIWGLLAHAVDKRWAWAAAFALVVLIGLSRLYLGVHFLSDVVVGWLLGGLVLWAFLRWEKPVSLWLSQRSTRVQILVAFLVSMTMLLLGFLSRGALQTWEMPRLWRETMLYHTGRVADPLSADTMLQIAGVFFGFGGGAAWLSGHRGYKGGGTFRQRVGRYVIGVCGLLLIWYGLGALIPTGETPLAHLVRYLQYCLIGAWVSAVVPLLSFHLDQWLPDCLSA